MLMPKMVAVAGVLAAVAACHDAGARDTERDVVPQSSGSVTSEYNDQFYRDMAQRSWSYLDAHYQPSTGFVNATPTWFNTTLWDLGGQFLAFHAAKEMGLLTAEEYDKRTRAALSTLERVELFDGAAFNRIYSTKDGSAATGSGAGWSATDLGRFLLALKILSIREPQYAEQAERIVRRNDFAQIVKDGYLHGRVIGANGQRSNFQEGRIGYEQYVAAGFSRWGANVGNAMTVALNARPVEVLGVPLLGDKRGFDRLLSEPFILHGLELGLSGELRDLAVNLLRAQEARYRSTGQITVVSEDAMPVKPHYFYYYCVYCNGKPFVIGLSSPRETLEEPRWVSTKAAFGWHALMPSEYTRAAVDHVAPARHAKHGWATGVFEQTAKSTDTYDVNTAAVLMEIAFYQLRGRKPLIEAASVER